MTTKNDGRLKAALILARQAVELLEELTTPPAPTQRSQAARPARNGASADERALQEWFGTRVPLSVDEFAVLTALDQEADEDGTYRRGSHHLARACHMGAERMRAALTSLAADLKDSAGTVTRWPLLEVIPGPRGRTDYALIGSNVDDLDQTA